MNSSNTAEILLSRMGNQQKNHVHQMIQRTVLAYIALAAICTSAPAQSTQNLTSQLPTSLFPGLTHPYELSHKSSTGGALDLGNQAALPDAPMPQGNFNDLNPRGPLMVLETEDQESTSGATGRNCMTRTSRTFKWIGAMTAVGGLFPLIDGSIHCGPEYGNTTNSCTSKKGIGLGLIAAGVAIVAIAASHPDKPKECPAPPIPPTAAPQAADSGAVPRAQAIGRNPSGATTTTIRNNTPYVLQVSLTGPQSLSVTVQPGQSQTLSVAPGQYQEFVQAFGPVQPLSGTQVYGRGTDWEQIFYIAPQ